MTSYDTRIQAVCTSTSSLSYAFDRKCHSTDDVTNHLHSFSHLYKTDVLAATCGTKLVD